MKTAKEKTAAANMPELSSDSAIRLKDLVIQIGGKVLHDHINLDVKRGEVVAVVGGSGSGKSVLLRALIGLLRPVSGSISILGQDIATLDEAQLQELRKHWGVLFQEGALFSTLTVTENIQMPMREFMPMPQGLMDEIAAIKLALVGLPPEAGHKYPAELSGGMKKRAGLARALALDPALVFLDEPSSGLDPISANQFDELIVSLQKTLNLTVFMVTHDIDSLRATNARIAMLVKKKLHVGSIEELMEDEDPWIHEYFGGIRGRAALTQSAGS